MAKLAVTRNAKGLVDVLFDNIEGMNNKTVDPEMARAISHTARTIVAIASLELEAKKFYQNASGEKPMISLEIESALKPIGA